MSNKVEIELKGIDELQKKLENMGKAGARIENKALREAGQIMADEMAKEAPRDTGKLKESIKVSGVKTGKGFKRVEVGPTVHYSHFIELGTSKMPANPFMARAYEANKEKIQSTIISEIKKGLGL